MDKKSWIMGVIVVLVIAAIAVSIVMWSNTKQANEAEYNANLLLEAEKARESKLATPANTTPGAPAAPAPSAP